MDNQGFDVNSGGCLCQDVRNPHEYANGGTDQRHNLVIAYVYRLPDFVQNRMLGLLANGYTLNGLITLASGNPVNIVSSTDALNIDNPWQRPNLVAGTNPYVANRSVLNGWYNAKAFATASTFGTTPRNSLIGPGTKSVNISASKDFAMPFAEGQRLQVRFEAFNALNTPQFSNPGSSFGSSTFGQITSTKINNRELQLAAKYYF